MGISAPGFLVLESLFSFVPYLLDTGVQIWNAVEVNEITTNPEFQYPTPLYFEEKIEVMEDCEEGWTFFPHTKMCYKLVTERSSWKDASEATCVNYFQNSSKIQQPKLVSISDDITNTFLVNLDSKLWETSNSCNDTACAYAWTGGYGIGKGNGGYWFDGKPWKYTNFKDGKPSNTSTGNNNYYLAMMCTCGDWSKGQWNNVPASYRLPSLCQYDPVISTKILPERQKREVRNETAIKDNIYSLNFSFKISFEGLVSLLLVQLPGLALGFLGIMKAFINHGCSKQALKDSLRLKIFKYI